MPPLASTKAGRTVRSATSDVSASEIFTLIARFFPLVILRAQDHTAGVYRHGRAACQQCVGAVQNTPALCRQRGIVKYGVHIKTDVFDLRAALLQCLQLHCGFANVGADDNDAAVPLVGAHKILPPQQRLIAHRAQDFDHGCRATEHKYLTPGCRAQIGGNEHRYIVIAYGVDNHFVEAGNAHQLFADGVIVAAAQLVKRDGYHLLRRVGAAGFSWHHSVRSEAR